MRGDILFEYEVIRSNRKTVSVQVLENGDVVLRVPLRYPDSKIQEIVNRNTEWIKKTQIKQAENMSKKLVLNDDEIKKLKKYAESYIRSRVNYFAKIMGVKPSGVKILRHKNALEVVTVKIHYAFLIF